MTPKGGGRRGAWEWGRAGLSRLLLLPAANGSPFQSFLKLLRVQQRLADVCNEVEDALRPKTTKSKESGKDRSDATAAMINVRKASLWGKQWMSYYIDEHFQIG